MAQEQEKQKPKSKVPGVLAALGIPGLSESLPVGVGGVAAGAYTGYQQAQGIKSLLEGEKPDAVQGLSTLPFDGGVGLASSLGVKVPFGGGKGKDQQGRDRVRGALKDQGLIGEDYTITLADGSKYNIGKDGGSKLSNAAGATRGEYDVDFSDERAGDIVALLQPVGMALTGGDKKLSNDLTGYLVNASLSNATTKEDAIKNAQAIVKNMGLTADDLRPALQGLRDQKAFDPMTYDVYDAGVNRLFGGVQVPTTAKPAVRTSKVPSIPKKAPSRPSGGGVTIPNYTMPSSVPTVQPGPAQMPMQPQQKTPEEYAATLSQIYDQKYRR